MTLYDLYGIIQDHQFASGLGIFILAILMENSKHIKFSPFSYLGNLLTKDVMQKVYASQDKLRDEINERIDDLEQELRYEVKASNMKQARSHIFRFAEGIRKNADYTDEHWNEMRDLCLRYLKFSAENDRFVNAKCDLAIQMIFDGWKERNNVQDEQQVI